MNDEQRPLKDYELFLAYALESHIWHGLLTAADVFAEIPLNKVVETYGDQAPNRRVKVIADATSLSAEVVRALDLEVQQTLLDTWYKTSETAEPDKPLKIFRAVGADDLVRFTEQKKIFAILKACREIAAKDPAKESGARENVAVMLDKLVELKLLGNDATVFEIYEAIGFVHLTALGPEILAATLKYLAYRNMRKLEKGLSPRIEVKDFYQILGARALSTLSLDIVEEVFKAFETKYDLIDEDRITSIPPAFAQQADQDLPVIPRLSEVPQGLTVAEGKGNSETPSLEMTEEEVVTGEEEEAASDQGIPTLDELTRRSAGGVKP